MILTHVKELIQQNLDKLLQLWPTAPAGVYSAGIGRKETHFPITFAGIASVANKAAFFGHQDLVLIDECHLVSPKENTHYQMFLAALKKVNPQLKVIGFTATHYRLGLGLLTEGDLFTDLCFDITGLDAFNYLIDEGYLSPLIPRRTSMMFDVSEVRLSGGEYKQNELQAAVDKRDLTYTAVKELVELGSSRAHWLIFASGVEHAEHIKEMLEYFQIPTCVVHSKMADKERDANIEGFKSGRYRAAVNNNVLTTGFDFPGIDLIGVFRPTSSPGLWVQMLGRGTRPVYLTGFDLDTREGRLASIAAGAKQNCLVLDFAGNTRRLGPINDPVIPKGKGKGGGGTAPVKVCEHCMTYNHAAARYCISCGAEFPKELKINSTAYTDEIIKSSMPQVEVFKVDRVIYTKHEKRQVAAWEHHPPSMQVTYYCGLRMFREWVCFEHERFALHKAHEWWKARSWDDPPETVREAIEQVNGLRVPTHIKVWIKKQNDQLLAHSFDDGNSFIEF
jgi:DNA repair protein RadD